MRKQALDERKPLLADLLRTAGDGMEVAAFLEEDGREIFRHACRLGHEGIVAKRKDLPYQSGRSRRWLKIRNPKSPAMQRYEDGTF